MEQIVFRNVGIYKSDAGESPKRKQTNYIVLHYLINTEKHNGDALP